MQAGGSEVRDWEHATLCVPLTTVLSGLDAP